MPFPTTEIGDIEISRLIIGSNPFHGFSHFSNARDEWLKEYFTEERIYEVVRFCAEQGLNATVAMQKSEYMELLRQVEDDTGQHIYYIATPGGSDREDLKQRIDECADMGCEFCWPHTSWTDARVVPTEDRIIDGPEILDYIRQRGMIPGWSTHRPEVIRVSDRADYDVAGYIQPLNAAGFLCPVETDWMSRVIQGADRPVLAIKPLAAGRVMPPTGLSFVYENIKPQDTVAIGMLSVREAREDIEIARQCIAEQRKAAEVDLQYTRSKKTLQ